VPVYAAHGTLELWVFDVQNESMSIYLDPGPKGYRRLLTPTKDDFVSPTLLPGVSIALADLWQYAVHKNLAGSARSSSCTPCDSGSRRDRMQCTSSERSRSAADNGRALTQARDRGVRRSLFRWGKFLRHFTRFLNRNAVGGRLE